MKRPGISLLLVLLGLPGLIPAQDQPEIQQADEQQKQIILNLEREIADYQRGISKLEPWIKKAGFIKDKQSRFPLRSEAKTAYGLRDRMVYSAEALVYWSDNGFVSRIEFREREAIQRTELRYHRNWYGQMIVNQHNSEPDKTVLEGYAVDFLSYTRDGIQAMDGKLFRTYTGSDLRDKKSGLDKPAYQLDLEPATVDVSKVQNRINILKDYLVLMQLLDQRVRYFTRDFFDIEESLEEVLPQRDSVNP
ncbi:MAG: hypothetical protein KDK39_02260 [Leptospiraceae bacterium]|nr:hypothetical protein [Leptospiraceae bacterium]